MLAHVSRFMEPRGGYSEDPCLPLALCSPPHFSSGVRYSGVLIWMPLHFAITITPYSPSHVRALIYTDLLFALAVSVFLCGCRKRLSETCRNTHMRKYPGRISSLYAQAKHFFLLPLYTLRKHEMHRNIPAHHHSQLLRCVWETCLQRHGWNGRHACIRFP